MIYEDKSVGAVVNKALEEVGGHKRKAMVLCLEALITAMINSSMPYMPGSLWVIEGLAQAEPFWSEADLLKKYGVQDTGDAPAGSEDEGYEQLLKLLHSLAPPAPFDTDTPNL